MRQVFTITRYYLENGLPTEEKTSYMHAGEFIVRDGEQFGVATDPRAVPVGPTVLALAKAIEVQPNLWFSYLFADPACDVAGATAEHNRKVPPGHWMWNMVEYGPPRPGVVFIDKGEYDDHCRHLAERAAILAKENAIAAEGKS